MSMLTIDDLLNNNKKLEEKAQKTLTIHVNEIDRDIEFHQLKKIDFLEILDDTNIQDKDGAIIYVCSEIFKNDNLLQKLNCNASPYDVVTKCLSTKTINALSKEIIKFSGLDLNENDNLVAVISGDIKK